MIMPPSKQSESTKISSIDHSKNRFDTLRLLAAWLVLFSHCFPLGGWPSDEPLGKLLGFDTFGGIGVVIFFVLSGYLVMISLEQSSSLKAFVRKRAVRIYPALMVACLLSISICGLFLTNLPWQDYFSHPTTRHYLSTALAWKVHFALPGVFESNPFPNAVNGSLWSLPYEFRCYLGLMLVFLIPIGMRFKLIGVLLFFVLASQLRTTVPLENIKPSFWGIDIHMNRLGFLFTLGALFATWRHRFSPQGWIGLLLIAVSFVLPKTGAFQLATFYAGVGILTLWLALKGTWLPKIPEKMGDWSYGTYLYGFPVQQYLAFNGVHEQGLFVFLVASTALTLTLAAFSWHMIERPALRWK